MNNKSWKSENTDSLGLLWLKLLAFYSNESNFKNIHLSVRVSSKVYKGEWKYFGQKLAIEGLSLNLIKFGPYSKTFYLDPFVVEQNICKNLLHQTNEYIFITVFKACNYFTLKTNQILNKDPTQQLRLIEVVYKETGMKLKDYFNPHEEYEKEIKVLNVKNNQKPIEISRQLSKRSVSECEKVMSSCEMKKKEKNVSLSIDFNNLKGEVNDLIEKINDLKTKDIDLNEDNDDEDESYQDEIELEDEENEDDDDEEGKCLNINETKNSLDSNNGDYSSDSNDETNTIESQIRKSLNEIINKVEIMNHTRQFIPVQSFDNFQTSVNEAYFRFESNTFGCDKVKYINENITNIYYYLL